ncbi:hypothetical protein WJX74_005855 [Apatococcus lobatus]|uniref:Uncharacterized protein n=1 Tax=Apatococcus lobatus TaxID=904363 RepID=A0AAW1SGF6_9CHLO
MVPCNPNLHELLGAARLARPDQGSCKATGPTVAFTYHMSRPEPAHDIPTVCLSSFQHSGSQKRKAQLTCDRLPEAVAYSHPRLKHAAASCRPTPSSDSAVSSTLELAQSRLFLQGTTPTSAFERPVLAYHGEHPDDSPKRLLGKDFVRPCTYCRVTSMIKFSCMLPPGVHGSPSMLLPISLAMQREWLNQGLPTQCPPPLLPRPSPPHLQPGAATKASCALQERRVLAAAPLQCSAHTVQRSQAQIIDGLQACSYSSHLQQHCHQNAAALLQSQQMQTLLQPVRAAEHEQARPAVSPDSVYAKPLTAALSLSTRGWSQGAEQAAQLSMQQPCNQQTGSLQHGYALPSAGCAAEPSPDASAGCPYELSWWEAAQKAQHGAQSDSGHLHKAVHHRASDRAGIQECFWPTQPHARTHLQHPGVVDGHSVSWTTGCAESEQTHHSHKAAVVTTMCPLPVTGQVSQGAAPDSVAEDLHSQQQLQQQQDYIDAWVQHQQRQLSVFLQQQALLQHQQQGLAQHPALACRTAAQLQRSSGNFQLSQVPHMADTKLQQLDATSFQERHHNCSSNSSAASMLRQCSVGGAVCNLFPQPESDPSGNTGSHFAAPAPRRAASAACGAHDLTATASRAAAAIDMQQSSVTHPHPCNTSAHVAYTQSSVTSHPIAWKCSRPADPQLQLQQTVAHSKPLLPAHSFALDCSRSAVLHPQLQQGLPYAGQQRVHAGHTSQSAGMPWGPSMMIVELIGKCACMLDLEQIDTVKLTIHLYGRIRSQVTSRKVVVEGRVVGMPLLLAGCLWIASKLEEGRKRIPSTTKMAALASTDRDLIAAVEVHLMDLLSWQPLFGWHSP